VDVGEVHAEGAGHGTAGHSHISDWFFGVLSFRTIVAFLAFFGLSGMAAQSSGASLGVQFVVALAAGMAAMYAMHAIMLGMRKLTHDGTLRIHRAIGATGTVYLPIPANRANTGKVLITLQQREVEFQALTPVGARLPAGAKVVVTGVVDGETLEVEPLPAEKPQATDSLPTA
jgi:membrane protein implicated in regulation of membrane protease activity